jgi:hypothetical protein
MMRKTLCLLAFSMLFGVVAHGQVMITKLVGKNSKNSKLGYGIFMFYEFPLTEEGNKSVRLELLDFAYYPRKDDEASAVLGYVSVKLGYKYVFSETKTGFYLEPQAGYCRTVYQGPYEVEAVGKDGIAVALEGGYSIEVGERGNTINLGVKYEKAMTGSESSISSVGLRASYSFGLFRKQRDY